MTREPSFPCIICGKPLSRVFSSPAQPSDGVMCTTQGNYGSTAFDSLDGEHLHFNICDACLTKAGRQGRLMSRMHYRNLAAPVGPGGMPSIVGIEKFTGEEVYEEWNPDEPDNDPQPARLITLQDLDDPPKNWMFHGSISSIRAMITGKNGG